MCCCEAGGEMVFELPIVRRRFLAKKQSETFGSWLVSRSACLRVKSWSWQHMCLLCTQPDTFFLLNNVKTNSKENIMHM